jgi:hypothetical protein
LDRAAALLQLERHRPYPLLFILRINRCPVCRCRWPCAPYVDARSTLLRPNRFDIAANLRLDNSGRWP